MFKQGLRRGVAAARANLRPAVGLWAVGMALLAAYYLTDAGRSAMEAWADWRSHRPWLYAAAATAAFGAVLPWLVMRSRASTRPRATWEMLAFLGVLWGWKGLEVHALYEGLAAILGDSNAAGVIAGKVALDQGLYAPLWAVPTILLAYRLHDGGYRVAALAVAGRRRWWLGMAVPVIIANAVVWTPAVAMIYALPLPLQLPGQNLVLCFWSLVLLFMTDRDDDA